MEDIRTRDTECGYADFREKYLAFPPTASLPAYEDLPNINNRTCFNIYNDVFDAVSLVNPCFDIYQVATTCPVLWDVLGCEYFLGGVLHVSDVAGTSITFLLTFHSFT